MPNPARTKSYYRVTFQNEITGSSELFQVCARNVSASDLYGLVEISDFVFPDSQVVYNPGEERIRREFQNVRKTWIPYHAIVRIDEVPESTATEIKVVSLETARQTEARVSPAHAGLIKKPE
jgi:hypothetical protein